MPAPAPALLPTFSMKQKTPSQERSRKYGGSSSFVDAGQPSRAPRQDEDGRETVGSTERGSGVAEGSSPNQGISNRPAKDEHAFPDSDEFASEDAPEGVEEVPKQDG